MSDTKNQAFHNVYNQLYDLLSFQPDETGAQDNVVVKLTPNQPLNPEDYENMYTPSNPDGDMYHAYNFAALADAIPDGKGGNLSMLYKSIIDKASIKDGTTEEQKKAYKEALSKLQVGVSEKLITEDGEEMVQVSVDMTPLYKGYCLAKSRYLGALAEYYRKVNDPSVDENKVSSQGILQEQRARLKMAYDNWTAANKDEVERLLATLSTCANDALASMFAEAQYTVGHYPGPANAPTIKFGPTAPLQKNWIPSALTTQESIDAVQKRCDEDIKRIELQLDEVEEKIRKTDNPDKKERLQDMALSYKDRIMDINERCRERISNIKESGASKALQAGVVYSEFELHTQKEINDEHTKKENYQVGVSASWGLFSFGGNGGYQDEKKSADVEESDIVISGKIAQIPVVRPWFNPLLFAAKNWSVTGFEAGGISDGKGKGALPMYATSLVVVKDLTIEGKFDSLHSTMENSSWSADASIGYGPFRFGPKYSGGKSEFHRETTKNGYKLTNEGYQLIGTINAIVPKCPSI